MYNGLMVDEMNDCVLESKPLQTITNYDYEHLVSGCFDLSLDSTGRALAAKPSPMETFQK
jgi:hypothetical protein